MRLIKFIATLIFCILTFSSWSQNGWTNQTPTSTYPGLMGIDAIDSAHIWAVGFEGIIIHSTDGGTNWGIVNTGYSDDFTSVAFLNRDTGFVSGNPAEGDAFILRTFDSGLNWQKIDLPVSVTTTVNDIDFFHSEPEDSIVIYATGGLGHIWKSKTLGDNWTRLEGGCGNGNFNSCSIIGEDACWFVGTPNNSYDYSIMATTDGGTSFVEQINPTERKLNGVSFANKNTGIAVGLVGTILFTENSGQTWENRPNSGYRWQSVFLTKSGKAWTVGDKGNIGYSTDYGYTWNMQISGVNCELWDVDFINDNEGWIVGGGIGQPGIVLQTKSGGEELTAIDISKFNDKYSLGQNQPNPFKNTTNINYHIMQPGIISIALYDILGNRLEYLVNEFRLPGDYTVNFSNTKYPTGIYLYDLKVGSELIQIRKMILK